MAECAEFPPEPKGSVRVMMLCRVMMFGVVWVIMFCSHWRCSAGGFSSTPAMKIVSDNASRPVSEHLNQQSC